MFVYNQVYGQVNHCLLHLSNRTRFVHDLDLIDKTLEGELHCHDPLTSDPLSHGDTLGKKKRDLLRGKPMTPDYVYQVLHRVKSSLSRPSRVCNMSPYSSRPSVLFPPPIISGSSGGCTRVPRARSGEPSRGDDQVSEHS